MCCVITPVCGEFAIPEGTVYAYDAQGDLRGVATIGNASDDVSGLCFLTISGNEDCPVSLILETTDGTLYTSESAIDYVSNSFIGTPSTPKHIAFRLGNATDIAETIASSDTGETTYNVAGNKVHVRTKGIVISKGKKHLNK